MNRLCVLACIVACCCMTAVMAGDRTLGTVSGPCKDQFNQIIKEHYASDTDCSNQIKQAMSTAPKSEADCPGGKAANVGSAVQKCMSKNQKAKDAWTSLIKNCEVLNVNERTGQGEAEAAAKATPSCFPRFDSLKAFTGYLEGKQPGSAKSAAGAKTAQGGLVLAAAAAGLCLLL